MRNCDVEKQSYLSNAESEFEPRSPNAKGNACSTTPLQDKLLTLSETVSDNLLKMHGCTQGKGSQWGPLTGQRIVGRCPMAHASTFCQPLEAPELQTTKMTGCTKIQTHYKWPFFSFCFVRSEQLASFSEQSVLLFKT